MVGIAQLSKFEIDDLERGIVKEDHKSDETVKSGTTIKGDGTGKCEDSH